MDGRCEWWTLADEWGRGKSRGKRSIYGWIGERRRDSRDVLDVSLLPIRDQWATVEACCQLGSRVSGIARDAANDSEG